MRRGAGLVVVVLILLGGALGCNQAEARLARLRRIRELDHLHENILAHRTGAGMRRIKPGNGKPGPRLMGTPEADQVGSRRRYDSRKHQRVGGGKVVEEEKDDIGVTAPRQPGL